MHTHSHSFSLTSFTSSLSTLTYHTPLLSTLTYHTITLHTASAEMVDISTTSLSNKSTPRLKKRKSTSAAQKCSLCGTSFVYRRCLLRHIKENHPSTDPDKLEQYIVPFVSSSTGEQDRESETMESVTPQTSLSTNETEVQIIASQDSIVEQVLVSS